MKTNPTHPIIICFMTIVTSCGSSSGGGGGSAPQDSPTPTQTQVSSYTMVVNTSSELPECGITNAKQLVYVTSEGTFKSCESGIWIKITITANDSSSQSNSGLSISSNLLLNPHASNLCTKYSSIESCYFNGGQMVKYSDGTVLITGTYSYDMYVPPGANGGYAEFDRVSSAMTLLIPPSAPGAFQMLDWSVSRGSTSFQSLFLVYDRATDTIAIVFDSNSSGTVNTGDETVHTVSKSNW